MARISFLLAVIAIGAIQLIRGSAQDAAPKETGNLAGVAADGTTINNSQHCYVLRGKDVELAVTKIGGHMAPVVFDRTSTSPIQPYYISPWQNEGLKNLPADVLISLRGDFFCLPFGGNGEAFNGERHPPHGEVAGGAWKFVGRKEAGPVKSLTLSFEPSVRKGMVTKTLALVDGHNAVYCDHTIDGFAGPTPLGHHQILAMPEKEGVVNVSTSPFKVGLTNPTQFSDPKNREYQALAIGASFTDLAKVPSIFVGVGDVDCTKFPTRTGFADLLAVSSDAASKGPAWTTAVNTHNGYMWYSLRDPAVLPTTVFWMENRGRHGSPWNGRNNCLGLEDVCANFADGLAASAKPNRLTQAGIKTAHELVADRPFSVRSIQGAVKTPEGFTKVQSVEFGPDTATFISTTGQKLVVPVKHSFLTTGAL